jgi:hypothetical protein
MPEALPATPALTDLLMSLPFLLNALAVYAISDALKRLLAAKFLPSRVNRAKALLTFLSLTIGAFGGVLLRHTGEVPQDALVGLVAGSSSASVHTLVKRAIPRSVLQPDGAQMNISIGRVKLPIFAIVSAAVAAARRCRASAADNKDASSPGGAKVTAAEVIEDFAVFLAVLGEELTPAVLKANGLA